MIYDFRSEDVAISDGVGKDFLHVYGEYRICHQQVRPSGAFATP